MSERMRTVGLLDEIPVASHSFCLALSYLELSDNYIGVHIHKTSLTSTLKICICLLSIKSYLDKNPNNCLKINFKKVYSY